MKKLYILVSAVLLSSVSFGQGRELFFSEYCEGAHQSGQVLPGSNGQPSAGTERAIEIFNPTTATVNMDQYSIRRYSNGSPTTSEEERLRRNVGTGANTLSPAAVFVYSAPVVTLNAIRNATSQYAADYTSSASTVMLKGGAANFNGDDAMALVRWSGGVAGVGNPIIVDIFGLIGHFPNKQWFSQTIVGTDTFKVSSMNHSITRRPHINTGNTTNILANNPNLAQTYRIGDEWVSYSDAYGAGGANAQSYAKLGDHAGDYTGGYGSYMPLGVLKEFDASVKMYPNPANGVVNISISKSNISSIVILNSIGQNIIVQPTGLDNENIKVDISSLKPGMYFVKITSKDNAAIYKELVVK